MWKIPFPWQKRGSLPPAPARHQFPLGVRAAGARSPAPPGRLQPSPGPPEPVPPPLSSSTPRGGDAPLQPPYWAHTGRPVTSWPNGGPRASPLRINPGGSPMLCPAVSSPLPGLAHPQLSPLSPAPPAPRSRQQLGGRGAARQRITLPLESRLPVCETRLFLPSALRPPLWPPWHSQSPAQLSLVPSGSCFLLFPLFPLPRSS